MKTLLVFALLTAASFADGPVRHVVHVKFKQDAEPAAVQKVVEEFAKLKSKIPNVESLEWGTDVSPEKLNKGFIHCWILTFKTEADRDTYLKHPAHQAFGALVKPVLDEVLVVDFIPRK